MQTTHMQYGTSSVIVANATKKCKTCGEEKLLTDFYAHTKMRDGYRNQCKVCVCARTRQYALDHPEHTRAVQKIRDAKPERRATREIYRQQYKKDHPHKIKAGSAVNNAVRAGKLIKPEQCECCKREADLIHGHHEDYKKPLDVMWLCPTCHAARHKEANNAYLARLNKDYDRYC